ncbi:MAG: DUF2079 domain-containing protein [Sulfobacillus thermotolerans]|nr:DUF2079 domain-containing protein [Sulfobacillus thermotolerans]
MVEDVWIRPEQEKRGEEMGLSAWTRILAYAALVVSAQILRWGLFVAHGFDLGYYQQGMAALVHDGLGARSTYTGQAVLAKNHAWLLVVLAYPATWLGTGFLFLVETLALASGYFPLMRIARAWTVPREVAAFVGALYLLSPLVIAGNLYDFHMSVLAVPLVLYAVQALMERHWGQFVAFLVLLTGCGSKAAIAVLMVALIAAVRRQTWWVGLAAIGGVLAWMFWGLNIRLDRLSALGWITVPVSHTLTIRAVLYALWVLAPFLVVLGALSVQRKAFPWSFYGVLALLYLGGNMLSALPASTSPFDQKSALIAPFLLLMLLDVAARDRRPWPFQIRAAGIFATMGLLVLMGFDFYHSAWKVRPNNTMAIEQALVAVPKNHPIYAQNNVLPHLGFIINQVPLQRFNPAHVPIGSAVIWDTQFHDDTTPPSVYRTLSALMANKRRARVVFDKGGVVVFDVVASR